MPGIGTGSRNYDRKDYFIKAVHFWTEAIGELQKVEALSEPKDDVQVFRIARRDGSMLRATWNEGSRDCDLKIDPAGNSRRIRRAAVRHDGFRDSSYAVAVENSDGVIVLPSEPHQRQETIFVIDYGNPDQELIAKIKQTVCECASPVTCRRKQVRGLRLPERNILQDGRVMTRYTQLRPFGNADGRLC